VSGAVLTAEKRDALQELVNIGMGAAGAALAQALGTFVELAVPGVDVTDRRHVAGMLNAGAWANQDLQAVRQPFFGALMGESLMMFDGQAHAQLADLLGYVTDGDKGAHQEVLLDLANVVIGACVNGIAGPLHETVSFSPPGCLGTRQDVHAFLSRDAVAWREGLVVNVDFKLEARSFLSRVLVFLPEQSLIRIDQALTRLLDELAAS
jgi:chemotaxis protein CheC